jgi:hypothetical protein
MLTEVQQEAFDSLHNYWLSLNRNVQDFVQDYAEATALRDDAIHKKVSKEAANKKKILLSRIEAAVGTIENSDLYIGHNGEINGTVFGSKANATVQTIYAGGYNIQRLHYRVLVKVIEREERK